MDGHRTNNGIPVAIHHLRRPNDNTRSAQLPPPTTQLLHSTTTPTIDGNMNADGIDHSQLHGAAMNEGQKVEHPKNQVSSPPTQTTMLGGSTTMVPLADPLDEATLSSGSVLLRKQIELFEATEADVADRKSKGGAYLRPAGWNSLHPLCPSSLRGMCQRRR